VSFERFTAQEAFVFSRNCQTLGVPRQSRGVTQFTYAIRGLPKGEVRIGRASMVVMVVTGLILIYYRVPSLDVLTHTRFGILLLVKLGLFLLLPNIVATRKRYKVKCGSAE